MATKNEFGSLVSDIDAAIEQLQEAKQFAAKGKHPLDVAKRLSWAQGYISQGNKAIIAALTSRGIIK